MADDGNEGAAAAKEIYEQVGENLRQAMEENPEFAEYLSTPKGVIDSVVRTNASLKTILNAVIKELSRLTNDGPLPDEIGPLVSEYMALDSTSAFAMSAYVERLKREEAADAVG